MKATISKRVQAIMSDPRQARELARQTIISQRSSGEGRITYNGETYKIVRSSDCTGKKDK